jgi:hypothetical protein
MAKKSSLIIVLLVAGFLFALLNSPKAYAGTITNLSDTITTSRPSAASPLSANAASGVTQVSIANNGSRYLASDSAKIMRTSTSADVTTGITIASQSSALTTVYFTAGTGAAAQGGTDVLITNITAMHKVSFSVPNPVPASGKIIITFPGSANTSASPSASTFAFNGLTTGNAASNISYKLDGTRTCTFAISAPSITCTVDSGGSIAAGTVITFLIGCGDSSSNETTCTTQSPRLINPTKTATAGSADVWSVNLRTQDASSVDIDSGKTAVGTVESVQVRATVDSSFTFTISGINNATAANAGNTTGCTNSESTSSGFDSTATLINLGSLPISSSVAPNISAQLITITTNANNGYTLTATSSGHLQDASTGFALADSTTPAAFPAATPWFGIHACGADVNTSTWGAANTTTTRGGTAKYGWPTQTSAVTLATDNTGPIIGTGGNGLTTVEYAAAADASVPSGNFTTVITYVATPVF